MAANDPYSDFRASEYAHGRNIAREKYERNTALNSMIESMRGENAARVAKINADVGMANIEAHKPLLGAQTSAITEMLPFKKRGAEQELEAGAINTALGKLQLGMEPEFLKQKLQLGNLGMAGYKAGMMGRMKEIMEGEGSIKETGIPNFLEDVFGKGYGKKTSVVAPPAEGEAVPPGTTKSDWRTSGFGRSLRVALPMIGAGVGGFIGGGSTLGAGTVPGAMLGGGIGESGAQLLYGEDPNLASLAAAILSGGLAGKYGGKVLKRPTSYKPGRVDELAERTVNWFGR